MSKKAAIIGTLFSDSSSESSSDNEFDKKYQTSISDNARVAIKRRSFASADEYKERQKKHIAPLPPRQPKEEFDVPEGFIPYDMKRISTLKHNTIIRYIKSNDKLIGNKYFKRYDNIAGSIIVGFYTHDKKNYTEKLNNIKQIFIKSISGGEDPLSGTLEVPPDQWKFIKRDSIISYKKKENDEWIYKAKFNAFFTAKDGTTRMSMTSERGFSYMCNPSKISEIRRHVSDTDYKLASVLKTLHLLEMRVSKLEKKNH